MLGKGNGDKCSETLLGENESVACMERQPIPKVDQLRYDSFS